MKRVFAFVAIAAMLVQTSTASAGGFFLLDRGVRANGRGGAFIAGADDPSAITYNPAGIAFSGRQLLLDVAYPLMLAEYTRVDSGGVTQPSVRAGQVPLPLPSAAYTDHFGLEKLTFGLGVFAPTAALLEWPESVRLDDGTRGPAPQRYSLLSMRGTLLANVSAAVAYRPIPELSIGLSVGVVTGSFAARTTISSCDGTICTDPEDPNYDSTTQINAAHLFAPIATLGVTYASDVVRIGGSVTTPYRFEGEGSLDARIPNAPIFGDDATLTSRSGGDPTADVSLRFPWVVRLGVEVRPTDRLRIEAAGVLETWSRQETIRITPDAQISDVFALGTYQLGPIVIPRNMKNTVSLRLGGELDVGRRVTLRAGATYETGSFGDRYLSALTLDSDKLAGLVGMSIHVTPKVSLDGTVGYIWMRDRNVTNSRVTQPNAIRPDYQPPVYVGNGEYSMDALYFGAGLRVRFAPPESSEEEEPIEEPIREVVQAPTDSDADGLLDPDDRCPNEAEDRDGFEDADGCPDADDDNDGVVDAADGCRLDAEDRDGFEDADGCPEADNDRDGVADASDACPLVVGATSNNGCPESDRDGDTVVDRIDNCPDEAGTVENHGCRVVQRVVIEGDHLEITEKVFFRTNSPVIDRRSYGLLDNIATVISAHPEIGVVAIEGHTDARGNAARNRTLSARRAAAVRTYLTQHGVDPARVTAEGFGSDRPVVPNATTEAEHEANRRVEFRIVARP